MKWNELILSGELSGYEMGGGTEIDDEVATKTPCKKCGGRCEFFPMVNLQGSYRAFAHCVDCDEAYEF